MDTTTVLTLLGAYAVALWAYSRLNHTLEGPDRWRMFRLLMLIPLSCVAVSSSLGLDALIRFL